jgi:hypothetical protein
MMTMKRKPLQGAIGPERAAVLLTGVDMFQLYRSPEKMKRDWIKHRSNLMKQAHEKLGPGRRCWAWWKFEAPEPRKRIGGRGIAAIETPKCPQWARELSFGRPVVWDADYADATETWFESQRDYLIRLKLLTPEEKKILESTASGGSGQVR